MAHGPHAYSNSSHSAHTPPLAYTRPTSYMPPTQHFQPRSPSQPYPYYRTDFYPPPGPSPSAAQLPPIHSQGPSRDYYARDRENHPTTPQQQQYAHHSQHHYQQSNHSSRASSPPPSTTSSRGGPDHDRDREHSSHSSHSNSASPYGSRTPQHSHALAAAPPPVPATFASIMNAYDNDNAPPYSSGPQSQHLSRPGTGSSGSINGAESGRASVNGGDRRRGSAGSAGMSVGGSVDDVQ